MSFWECYKLSSFKAHSDFSANELIKKLFSASINNSAILC